MMAVTINEDDAVVTTPSSDAEIQATCDVMRELRPQVPAAGLDDGLEACVASYRSQPRETSECIISDGTSSFS